MFQLLLPGAVRNDKNVVGENLPILFNRPLLQMLRKIMQCISLQYFFSDLAWYMTFL